MGYKMTLRILVCGSRWYGRPFDFYSSEEDRLKDIRERVEPQKRKLSDILAKQISTRGYSEYLYDGQIDVINTIIISGMAKGADTLAVEFAEFYGIPTLKFPANWDRYKKGAGPIRNQRMIDEGKPNLCIAFLMQNSRGTRDMINRCLLEDIETIIIED
jgi:hypothetical protein